MFLREARHSAAHGSHRHQNERQSLVKNLERSGSQLLLVCRRVEDQGSEKMSNFEGAGEAEGLQIWRIEDFEVVPWAKEGTFHSGDSFIILKVSLVQVCDFNFFVNTSLSFEIISLDYERRRWV